MIRKASDPQTLVTIRYGDLARRRSRTMPPSALRAMTLTVGRGRSRNGFTLCHTALLTVGAIL